MRFVRSRMRSTGYWAHFLMGVTVGAAFGTMWLLAAWAIRRKGFPSGLIGPAAILAIFSGGIASRAWVVRRLVDEREMAA